MPLVAALLELAGLVCRGLSDLGHAVTTAFNEIREPVRAILLRRRESRMRASPLDSFG